MTEYQLQAMSRTGETGEIILRSAAPRALSNDDASAIHRMPYVRACLLEYANRPCDDEASAVVKAIATQFRSLATTQATEAKGSA